MRTATLEIPLTKTLKEDAEAIARQRGFSSLAAFVRALIQKVVARTAVVDKDVVHLSERAEKRYIKITEDFKKGRNVYTAKGVDDLMKQLHEHPLS